MVANKSMGSRPWLQHAAASRLVAMLQNSISQANSIVQVEKIYRS